MKLERLFAPFKEQMMRTWYNPSLCEFVDRNAGVMRVFLAQICVVPKLVLVLARWRWRRDEDRKVPYKHRATGQHSTAQHRTAPHRTARPGPARPGLAWPGLA